MKSKSLYLAIFALAAFVVTGCEKSTEGLTWITYYPTIEVLGNNPAILYMGESYADEGCYAELNGEDVSDQAVVTSNVNTNKIGVYSVTYSVENEDGFFATGSRTVYVVDESAVANLYLGESQYGSRHYYNAPVYITDNGDGTYFLDDLCGGFYWSGRYPGYEENYGYDLHAEVDIEISGTTVTQIGVSGSWYFGDEILMSDGTFDPETRTFVYTVLMDPEDETADTMAVTLRAITK